MKKVLLCTLCLLVLPALAQAVPTGAVKACGNVTVWGLFGAPASENPDMICWVECCDGSPVGGALLDGAKCIQTTGCGKFCFSLTCKGNVVRLCTKFKGKAQYLGGMFYVCGNSIPYELKCSPQQITIIPGIKIDLNNCS